MSNRCTRWGWLLSSWLSGSVLTLSLHLYTAAIHMLLQSFKKPLVVEKYINTHRAERFRFVVSWPTQKQHTRQDRLFSTFHAKSVFPHSGSTIADELYKVRNSYTHHVPNTIKYGTVSRGQPSWKEKRFAMVLNRKLTAYRKPVAKNLTGNRLTSKGKVLSKLLIILNRCRWFCLLAKIYNKSELNQ